MTRLRVAVVGAGIGAQHVAGYNASPDLFDVRVICDRDLSRAAALAGKVTAGKPGTHADYDDALLGRDDIDVIDICLPPFLHGDAVRRALAAGKHVICEKPLVGSPREAAELEAAAGAAGRALMPVFQARFGNGLARAKHLIGSGAAGRVFLTTAQTHWTRGPAYYDVKWRGTRAYELGGAFLGHAIHIHDMLTTLIGPVRQVSAMTAIRVNPIETEDCGGAVLEMADGSIAVLSVTLGSADEVSRLRIMAENVTVESHGEVYASAREPWVFLPKAPRDQAWLDAALADAPRGQEGFAEQFARFHAAITTGAPLPVTVAEAWASLELASAIYHSARTGERVRLPLTHEHPAWNGW